MGLSRTPLRRAAGRGAVAALTFDDGPNGAVTEALLDLLADHGIRAVFCVVGANVVVPGAAALLRRMVAEGHLLGNHGMTYEDMGRWPVERVDADLRAVREVVRDAVGDADAAMRYFRAPNGSWGRTAPVAVALGMQPLAVVNTIGDWATQDVPTLETNLRAAIRPGELVLAHDGGGDRRGTLAAVRTVLAERLAEGWTFTLPAGAG